MLQIVMRSSIVIRSMRRAAVLVGEADAALDAEPADDRQDDVLRVDARRQLAVDVDAAHLQRIQRQALRGEHVADLRRADAERDGAERAVRRGVAVAAGDRHARLRQPELGPDDVDDALVLGAVAAGRPQLDAELPAVALERRRHLLGGEIDERPRLRAGRHDVIDRRERPLGIGDAPAVLAQHVERLRARDLVNEVQADEQLRLPARQHANRVRVPDFMKESARHCSFPLAAARPRGPHEVRVSR